VTRRSILEYAQALRPRYRKTSKEEKSKMLDEFIQVTGFHRKAAIRLLNRVSRLTPGKRRGRKRKYGSEVAEALKEVWEASDRLCSKRLKPFIPEMAMVLRRHGEQRINASLETQLWPYQPVNYRPIVTTLPQAWWPKTTLYYQTGKSAEERHTHQDFCRLERGPARIHGNRPGGSLWREYRGFLPEHTLCRGRC